MIAKYSSFSNRIFVHFLLMALLLFSLPIYSESIIQPGADNIAAYLPLLQNQRVAVFANHSSRIGQQHLVDVLLAHNINVVKIFAPEHGFRGVENNRIRDNVDAKSGIPVISLYGRKVKAKPEDLTDVDIIVFDIQDVGVRFYTYISSLQKLMEAAVENNKPLIILDRPNPNGFYVDGPVLEKQYTSLIGMQPIPLVYGMTMGEYAKMLVGEQWLNVTPKSRAKQLQLTVIPCQNYTHKSLYIPPVKPSPNLPNIKSIYWYPSIGLLESTILSVGRGTATPFLVFGHPSIKTKFHFTPDLIIADTRPPFYKKVCHGWNLQQTASQGIPNKLEIAYLLEAYRAFPNKSQFFNTSFAKAAGNALLEKQVMAGLSEEDIRKSWEPELKKFKDIRRHYLLYADF